MLWKIVAIGAVALLLGWVIYYQIKKNQDVSATKGAAAVDAAAQEAEEKKEQPVLAESQKKGDQGIVYELEDKDLDNFVSTLGDGKVAVVMFYMPGCGYCQKMFPEFVRAATQDAQSGNRWGQLDGTKFVQLSKKFNVSAFPTTIVFARGEVKQVVPGAQDGQRLNALIKG